MTECIVGVDKSGYLGLYSDAGKGTAQTLASLAVFPPGDSFPGPNPASLKSFCQR